jgi:4-hydroxy-tetrahydrodipicolinate synthase
MITGSIVALVTPMHPGGALDWEKLDALIAFHLANATDAIVAVGTTGESATLDMAEHCRVIERVVTQVAGRIPVIAGTGANSTTEAIELTREAKRLRADACLLVTPYYNKPTQDGLYRHFRAVAEAVEIPQILYNVPGRTAVDMKNDTVLRLAEIPNIAGIKDATGDLVRGAELISRLERRMPVYSGDDATAGQLLLAGARGNISVTANIMPRQMHELCQAAMRGDRSRVEALNHLMAELNARLFIESNPIPVKYALHRMGLIESGIRLPLTWLDAQYQPVLDAALNKAGLI